MDLPETWRRLRVSSTARDLVVAVAVGVGSLGLYVATLQPDFGGPEDTPKFQFIGYVLGVPHPPGYPLYVLLSHLFVSLPLGATVAWRANLFSAVMGSIACVLAFAIARMLGARRWAACCAALGFATGASVWRSAVFAEVYTLAAVMAAATVAALLAWGRRGGAHRFLLAVGAFAAGLGNHLTIVGIAPAFALYALARGRRVVTARTLVASSLVFALGIAQYAFIVIRTRQEAPYLETRASRFVDLFAVVTAERFAGQRFAFGPTVLLTDHLPALSRLISRELGLLGTVLFLAGLAANVRQRDAWLVFGAAFGMFAMVLNITGDLKGFITPLMALLWPFAALGIEAVAAALRSRGAAGRAMAAVALAMAAALPLRNVIENYAEADRSNQDEQARFLRAALGGLPAGAAFVAEDYWSDMALHYFRFTREAGGPNAARIGFDAMEVRKARRDGHRVFALANAATFLAAEGLPFTRTPVADASLDDWLARLPRGTVVAGAAANTPPPDLTAVGHPDMRPPGRLRSFEAFAAVVQRPGAAWAKADDAAVVAADAQSLGLASAPVAQALDASADPAGARVDLSGRTVARAHAGLALAAVGPDGTLLRALAFEAGALHRVDFAEALYELAGESSCQQVRSDSWTDVGAAFARGSSVATMAAIGSVVVDLWFPSSQDVRVRSTLLIGEGNIRTIATDGDRLSATLTRAGESRPVFRIALDRVGRDARARLHSGGAVSSLSLCSHQPVHSLLGGNATSAALEPDFESEPYFGAGWGDAERTANGPVRAGGDGATLFLPLGPGDYFISFDLSAPEPVALDVSWNGVPAGSCHVSASGACGVPLDVRDRSGDAGTLTFSVRGRGANVESRRTFTLRGARIERNAVVR